MRVEAPPFPAACIRGRFGKQSLHAGVLLNWESLGGCAAMQSVCVLLAPREELPSRLCIRGHSSSTTVLSLPKTLPLVQARSAREPQQDYARAPGSECLSRSWSLGALRSLGFRDWGTPLEEQVSRSDPMDLHSSRAGAGSDYMEVSKCGIAECPPHACPHLWAAAHGDIIRIHPQATGLRCLAWKPNEPWLRRRSILPQAGMHEAKRMRSQQPQSTRGSL